MLTWHTEKRKISELNPAPYNPRQMTEKQASDLKTSLERFSLADPIIINLNNTIIGGHQRINIYKTESKTDIEVDVRVPDRLLTPEEEKELNLRLNKNLGEFDFDALANNFDIEQLLSVGFEKEELFLGEGEGSKGVNTKKTIAFTVNSEQYEIILQAIEKGKELAADEIVDIRLSRGNALAYICRDFMTEHINV